MSDQRGTALLRSLVYDCGCIHGYLKLRSDPPAVEINFVAAHGSYFVTLSRAAARTGTAEIGPQPARSLTLKIVTSSALLMATIIFESFIPERRWSARYPDGVIQVRYNDFARLPIL